MGPTGFSVGGERKRRVNEPRATSRFWAPATGGMEVPLTEMGKTAGGGWQWGLDFGHMRVELAMRHSGGGGDGVQGRGPAKRVFIAVVQCEIPWGNECSY